MGARRDLWPLVLALTAGLPLAAQERPLRAPHPFSSGIEITSIAATVFDPNGRPVADLPRSAFTVREDGELQVVTQFTRDRVPLSLGVLIDVSDSMYGRRLQDARAAVERFLFELLDPSDEFFIMAFNHAPHLLTPWTESRDVVGRALGGLRPSGGTAVYDAVMNALPLVERRSKTRAALVIISDGADTASDATMREVQSALRRQDAFVYAIAIDPPGGKPINERVNPATLRELTDESGGRTEVVRTSADMASATSRFAEELNSQYLLGYTSPHGGDGKYHSISVSVQPSGYRVRARRGYVATPSPIRRPN